MTERFTDRARKVMQLANQEAKRFNHEWIGTEHLLVGLVKEGNGVASVALLALGVDLRVVRAEVCKLVSPGPDLGLFGKMPLTPRTKKVLCYAEREADELGHTYIGTEHLLLGLLREGEGIAAQVLVNLGVKPETVREKVFELLGVPSERSETMTNDELNARENDLRARELEMKAREAELDSLIASQRKALEAKAHDQELIEECSLRNTQRLALGRRETEEALYLAAVNDMMKALPWRQARKVKLRVTETGTLYVRSAEFHPFERGYSITCPSDWVVGKWDPDEEKRDAEASQEAGASSKPEV